MKIFSSSDWQRWLTMLLVVAIMVTPSCTLLQIPFSLLGYGLQGLKWLVSNLGGLIPLATMLVMADPVPNEQTPPPDSLQHLLEESPPGVLAIALVPAAWLEKPGLRAQLEQELRLLYPGHGGIRTFNLQEVTAHDIEQIKIGIPVLTPCIPSLACR